jgi:hypothetical protein
LEIITGRDLLRSQDGIFLLLHFHDLPYVKYQSLFDIRESERKVLPIMAANGSSIHHKVIIIGAGFNGVAAAKTYLLIKPNADILLIDRGRSLGGVSSASTIYTGLTYEMPAPLINYTDMTMRDELGIED